MIRSVNIVTSQSLLEYGIKLDAFASSRIQVCCLEIENIRKILQIFIL